MEAVITIVGFLGAGKTTLLKRLIEDYLAANWQPFVVLNDYENANFDALQLIDTLGARWIKGLAGSCICCSGINELRATVNRIPKREKGVTLIEANGTTDACALMEFLGVGLHDRFLPPIQISVVNVNNWQNRAEHNELEANQIQVSSLLVLTHLEKTNKERQAVVVKALKKYNPYAKIVRLKDLNLETLSTLLPLQQKAQAFNHEKAHWASCSCDLPDLPDEKSIYDICSKLPSNLLRVKGCVQIINNKGFTYFERNPDGEVFIRPFNGVPTTGCKLLTIGPNSSINTLKTAIAYSLNKASSRL